MAGKYIVKIRITDGKLIPGSIVAGASHGVTADGLETFDSTWSGIYDRMSNMGTAVYHMFRDGEVNGHKQKSFGMPIDQFEM